MSFWLFPSFSGYVFVPTSSFSLIPEPEATIETSVNIPVPAEVTKAKVKLNISRQDLIKAGYNHKRNSWTEEEDKKLLQLAKSQNLNWNQIGEKMDKRNSKMCYSRYRRLCYQTKKRWTSKEQSTILECIKKQGFDWKLIAKQVPGRTARQIEQHYSFCLRPDINKSQWTLEQDLLLVKLLQDHGTNWKQLQQQIKGRSENQIKNRYFGRLLKISAQKQKQTSTQIKIDECQA